MGCCLVTSRFKYLIESTLPSKEFGKLPPEGKPCSPHSDVLLQPQVLHLMLHPEGQGQRSRTKVKVSITKKMNMQKARSQKLFHKD